MGSSETILYTLSIYFGSIGIKDIRYTLIAGFIAEIVGFIAAVAICNFMFG